MNGSPKTILKHAAIVALLFCLGMIVAYGFWLVGLKAESDFMVFVLAVTIAILETGSGGWGVLLGVLYILAYDYFFTMPYHQLRIFNLNDWVACAVFIVVAVILNTLTARLQRQVGIAERDARVLGRLNKMSTGLINSTSAEGACRYSANELSRILDRPVSITLGEPAEDDEAARACYHDGYATGSGESIYALERNKYLPLNSKQGTLGVVAIDCASGDIDRASKSFVNSVITQTSIAVERNNLEKESVRQEVEMKHERFKTTLLRSISHDLRTPLTGIAGSAEYLRENAETTDAATRDKLLADIVEDSEWLTDMVNSLLDMTRMQDSGAPLEKEPEVVDDVIADAVSRVARRSGTHEISVHAPQKVTLVPMNGQLIRQTLINLIDNALKHTRPGAHIDVGAEQQGDEMVFFVSDNGGGIDPAKLDRVFDLFYTQDRTPAGDGLTSGRQSSIGLGLSICRSIVEAHGGWIRAENNDQGGTTFSFGLPMGQKPEETADAPARKEE